MGVMKGRRLAVDIGYSSLKVLAGESGLEVRLERAGGGHLTPACREDVVRKVRSFLGRSARMPRALCALPSRGISFRRFSVPKTSRDETERLLAFQVEKELPLPPERIAWTYEVHAVRNGAAAAEKNGRGKESRDGLRDVIFAAMRREILEDYEALIRSAGLSPSFTVGALAAAKICPPMEGPWCLLDLGRTHSELLFLDGEKPVAVRTIFWGGASVTEAIARSYGIDESEAESIKKRWAESPRGDFIVTDPLSDDSVAAAAHESLRSLGKLVRDALQGEVFSTSGAQPAAIRLVGGSALLPTVAAEIQEALGDTIQVAAIEVPLGPGRSAVTVGLAGAEQEGTDPPLTFLPAARRRDTARKKVRLSSSFWIGAVTTLALVSLCLRYGLPLARLPGLQGRLDTARTQLASLPNIDRELGFLDLVSSSQTPFLEAMVAMSQSAPQGTLLESLSMTRLGEVAIQGKASSFEAANEFRAKLARSGWFGQIVIQDQAPSKEQGKVEFRMSARLKPGAPPVPVPPPAPAPSPAPAASSGAASGAATGVQPAPAPPPVSSPATPEKGGK